MKKILAIMLAVAMSICMMPAMAFADEATEATNESNIATEATVEESAPVEEVAPAEDATVEAEPIQEEAAPTETAEPAEESAEAAKLAEEEIDDTSELSGLDYEVDGYWKGFVFYYTGDKEALSQLKLLINTTESTVPYSFKMGANDLGGIAQEYASKADSQFIMIFVTDYNKVFVQYALCAKVSVNVDEASDKDVTFKYGIDCYLGEEEDEENSKEKYSIIELGDEGTDQVGLLVNKIVLKAGQKKAEGYLLVGAHNGLADAKAKDAVGIVFKELSNDGGYVTDDTMWIWAPYTTNGALTKALTGRDELQDAIDEVNALTTVEEQDEFLMSWFDGDGISFNHEKEEIATTVVKKGVQTGDNNELGLWLAMMAIAGATAAAVALKRREN